MESFNLNIIPGKAWPVCHASQYDIGRTIRINLFEGGTVYTLDGTEVISISVRKPDGNVVTESVTNTSDSYVEFITTEQMTACHGSNLCELKLEKGADVIGTMNFILEVEQDPLEGGVQSASEIDNLQTQIAGMVAAEVADQYDSANVIFDASPVPGHGNGYAVTSEGVAAEVSTLNAAIGLKQDITDANLQTTDTTIVGAINELNSGKQDATDSNLQTTDQTVVGAINELLGDIGNKPDYSVRTGLTVQTNYIDDASSYYIAYTIGKLVFVKARLKASSTIGNNYGLIYNLPIPLDVDTSLMPVLRDGHDFNNTANIKNASCVVNTTGTLILQIYPDTVASGDYLYINSMYISA